MYRSVNFHSDQETHSNLVGVVYNEFIGTHVGIFDWFQLAEGNCNLIVPDDVLGGGWLFSADGLGTVEACGQVVSIAIGLNELSLVSTSDLTQDKCCNSI